MLPSSRVIFRESAAPFLFHWIPSSDSNRIKALVLFILGVTTLILTFFASLYFGLFCYFVLFIWSAFDAFSRDVDSEKMPFLDKMPAFRFHV